MCTHRELPIGRKENTHRTVAAPAAKIQGPLPGSKRPNGLAALVPASAERRSLAGFGASESASIELGRGAAVRAAVGTNVDNMILQFCSSAEVQPIDSCFGRNDANCTRTGHS